MNTGKLAAACSVFWAMVIVAEAFAAPAAGDSWAYRVVNRYNDEVLGRIQYRVDRIDAGRVAVAFSGEPIVLGGTRTEIYTPDGNWWKHAVINHDQPVDYEFTQPYPAYVFPLDTGQSWSLRVNAVNAASGRRASVRVDGEVIGSERITVPAGAFDTIKVRRRIYAGDFDGPRSETTIAETEWYAPALGRAVRIERNSSFMDRNKCSDEMSACSPVRGDWHIFELVEAGSPAR